MRLSERIKTKIKRGIHESFGEADLYLFGSRVDDTKKGGDIDLAVDVTVSRDEFRKKRSLFKASLLRQGIELKIDLVPFQNSDKLLSQEIQENNIQI